VNETGLLIEGQRVRMSTNRVFQFQDATRTQSGRKANDLIFRPGGDQGAAIDALVGQYQHPFGRGLSTLTDHREDPAVTLCLLSPSQVRMITKNLVTHH
jgi:hypothetical protein